MYSGPPAMQDRYLTLANGEPLQTLPVRPTTRVYASTVFPWESSSPIMTQPTSQPQPRVSRKRVRPLATDDRCQREPLGAIDTAIGWGWGG